MSALVVGAGPVGLMAAYWLMQRGFYVTLYEPREFTRQQILYMLSAFWESVPAEVKVDLQTNGLCYYDSHPLLCSAKTGQWVNILLSQFQSKMLKFLLQKFQGKLTLKRTAISLQEILALRGPQIVAVCDGGAANGLVPPLWKTVDNTEPFSSVHVANAMVITFDGVLDEKQTVREKPVHYLLDTPKQHMFITYRALPNHGYIAVQLSEATMKELAAQPKNNVIPYFVDKTPEGAVYTEVVKTIGYSNLTNLAGMAFPINLRSAKRYYYEINDKSFFVLGDAAFTTHFFTGTGMNRGLESLTSMIKVLALSKSQWPRFEQDLIAIRDTLWMNVIGTVLTDVSKLIAECKGANNSAECEIEGSRFLHDPATVQQIKRKIDELHTVQGSKEPVSAQDVKVVVMDLETPAKAVSNPIELPKFGFVQPLQIPTIDAKTPSPKSFGPSWAAPPTPIVLAPTYQQVQIDQIRQKYGMQREQLLKAASAQLYGRLSKLYGNAAPPALIKQRADAEAVATMRDQLQQIAAQEEEDLKKVYR